jgi:alcohol dehydrogenase
MYTINDFDFKTVADIRFAVNAALSLPTLLIARFNAKSIILITDKGLLKSGVLDDLLNQLEISDLNIQI